MSISSTEPTFLLVRTKNANSGQTQFWKSVIHRLPVVQHRLGVCSLIQYQTKVLCTCSKNRVWPEFVFLALNKRKMGPGDKIDHALVAPVTCADVYFYWLLPFPWGKQLVHSLGKW